MTRPILPPPNPPEPQYVQAEGSELFPNALLLLEPRDIDLELESIARVLVVAETGNADRLLGIDPQPPYSDLPGVLRRKAELEAAQLAYRKGRITVLQEWYTHSEGLAQRARERIDKAIAGMIDSYQGAPGMVGWGPAVSEWRAAHRNARELHGLRRQVGQRIGVDPGLYVCQLPDGALLSNPVDVDDPAIAGRLLGMMALVAVDLQAAGLPFDLQNLKGIRTINKATISQMTTRHYTPESEASE